MMIIHHKNHLHILDTSPASMHTAYAKPGSTANSLNHPHILCCCQVTASTFFHDCRLAQQRPIASVISSETLTFFHHFSSTTSY